MRKKFDVKSQARDPALSEALGYIHEQLAAMKLKTKDAVRAELMCEESLVSLMDNADFSGTGHFTVSVRKVFGTVTVELAVPGREFEFSGGTGIQSLKDDEELQESYEAIRSIVLRSFSGNIRYRHSGNINTVRIKAVRSSYAGLYQTLAALFLAVVSGVMLRILPPLRPALPSTVASLTQYARCSSTASRCALSR